MDKLWIDCGREVVFLRGNVFGVIGFAPAAKPI
jgi:hypothetical protein